MTLPCISYIDERGDINLNGIAYEIADWVMFINYLLYGDTAFYDYAIAEHYAATDTNADEDTATVDDLVYLARVIVGEAVPYPSPAKISRVQTVKITQDIPTHQVYVTTQDSLKGLYLVFDGEIDPSAVFDSSYIAWNSVDGRTNVLIHDFSPGYPSLGAPITQSTYLFTYSGDGILWYAQAAYDGVVDVPVELLIPDCCALRADMDYSGEINVTDLTLFVEFLFRGGLPPVCPDHGDIDASGESNVSDVTALVDYLFRGGAAPAAC